LTATTKKQLHDVGEQTLLESINYRYEQASKEIKDIPQGMLDYYKTCDIQLSFNLPLVRSDGKVEQIQAFRTQHKLIRLPCKGGLRYSDDFNMYDCEAIAL
jgi:glutamate dehydrogenase (NAD(P)+)